MLVGAPALLSPRALTVVFRCVSMKLEANLKQTWYKSSTGHHLGETNKLGLHDVCAFVSLKTNLFSPHL